MGRSSKKGPFVDPRLYEKVEKQLSGGDRDPIKTWSRACTIVPEFIGLTFMVGDKGIEIAIAIDIAEGDIPTGGVTKALRALCKVAQGT